MYLQWKLCLIYFVPNFGKDLGVNSFFDKKFKPPPKLTQLAFAAAFTVNSIKNERSKMEQNKGIEDELNQTKDDIVSAAEQ